MTNFVDVIKELPEEQQEVLLDFFNKEQYKLGLYHAEKLTEQYPRSAILFNLKGVFHVKLNLFNEAVSDFNRSIELAHGFIEPRNNLAATYNKIGLSLQDHGKSEEAVQQYEAALKVQPQFHQAYNNIGVILQEQKRFETAMVIYDKALEINPSSAQVFKNKGVLYFQMKEFEFAIKNFKKALRINPEFYEVHANIAEVLERQGKLKSALEFYAKSLEMNPGNHKVIARKLARHAGICDWAFIKNNQGIIPRLGMSEKDVVEPLDMLALEDAPQRHKKRSEVYAKLRFSQVASALPPRVISKVKRLRIGYFSADFREHAVAYLICKVLEIHDRDKFEIFAFSLFSEGESEIQYRLKRGVDGFYDVSGMSDLEVSILARKMEIDIAVDLTGYTLNSRPMIFAHRASAIQINYLGYPGTMGADFMDYIIADEYLIPEKYQEFYSEKIIYMPHHYQAQNDIFEPLGEAASREKVSLPAEGFVFCSISNPYKITPSEFDIWMRLLQAVDGSILWLLELNTWAKESLLSEAKLRGIGAERLVFAKQVSRPSYLNQFKNADLFLDTFYYNAGATASDALWAGLPVLTKSGKGYASRMAGSLLSSLGLTELITTSESHYEKMALKLARDPKMLGDLRERLRGQRESLPFFKPKIFTLNLEDAYQKVYQRYSEGGDPETISVLA